MHCKLMIVEDEQIIREGLAAFDWHTIGVEIVGTFDNGFAALEYLQQNTVDIALVDMRMPIMDGVEFVKNVRKAGIELQVICLSGYSDYEYLRECMILGVRDYLLKPTDKGELFRVVSQLIVPPGSYVAVRAKEYIHANYMHLIKLEDIATYVNLSPVYFSYVFKRLVGSGFVDYLTDYRIKQAGILLKDSTMNINEIAREVGFCNPRYFSEVFKKKKGMTPSEYRNR